MLCSDNRDCLLTSFSFWCRPASSGNGRRCTLDVAFDCSFLAASGSRPISRAEQHSKRDKEKSKEAETDEKDKEKTEADDKKDDSGSDSEHEGSKKFTSLHAHRDARLGALENAKGQVCFSGLCLCRNFGCTCLFCVCECPFVCFVFGSLSESAGCISDCSRRNCVLRVLLF